MIIRRYRASDQDVVTDLWSRAVQKAHPFLDGEDRGEQARILREVDLVRTENWVAEREGSVVGLLGMLPGGDGDGSGDGPGAGVGGSLWRRRPKGPVSGGSWWSMRRRCTVR